MPTINLHLDDNRKLAGITEKDQKYYVKFLYKIKNLGDESITFSYSIPRSGKYHRRFFAMLQSLYDGQEVFRGDDGCEALRYWLELCVGYYQDFVLPSGEIKSVVKSIDYDHLDQEAFEQLVNKIWNFVRSEECRNFLWPHMSDGVSEQMVESLLREFER